MGFLDEIGDFFVLFFSKDPAAARGRKELRAVRSYLRTVRPAVYKAAGNQVLPAFAASVHGLAAALRPVKELAESTMAAPDARQARRFRDFLVESRLPEAERELAAACSYEGLKARLEAAADKDAELRAAEAEARRVDAALGDPALRAADAELAALEAFVDLCRYDFFAVLRPFDPHAAPDSPSYKPRFAAAEGSSCVSAVADFYSVAEGVRFGPSVAADLAALASRCGGGDGGAGKRLDKAVSAASRLLSTSLSPALLTALLRAARGEWDYKPPAQEAPPSAVAAYRERFRAAWTEARERALRELKESSMGDEIRALFGDPPAGGLRDLVGFDADLDRRLREGAGRSFAWLVPLRLLKTFESRFLSTGYLEAARVVVVEGFFENAVLRSRLTDSAARLEKSAARIAAFEEAAGGRGRVSAASLRSALEAGSSPRGGAEGALRIAAALDGRAKELVEQDVRSLRDLAEAVYDVIGDFRKPVPESVTNIKTLAASRDRNLLPLLADGYNASARFLKIMKAYLVVADPAAGGDA